VRLLYELPEKEQRLADSHLGGEEILYCVPTDITKGGRFASGYGIVTSSRFVLIEDGLISVDHEIVVDADYRAIPLVGSGRLEMTKAMTSGRIKASLSGHDRPLARYSKTFAGEFSTIARALTQLAGGETPKFDSFDEDRKCPQCGRAFGHGSRVCPVCMKRGKILKRLLQYAKPYRLIVAAAFVYYAAITALNLLIPRISRAIVDLAILPGKEDLGFLLGIVGLNALAVTGVIVFQILRGRILAKLGNGVERDLRQMVFSKIQALSLGYVNRQKTGNLMTRITGDTGRIQRFIAGFTSELLGAVILIIGATLIILLRDWRLALMIVLPMPIVFVILKLAFKALIANERKLWRTTDFVHHLLQDVLSGIRVVKAYGREKYEIGRFNNASAEIREISERVAKIWNTLIPFFGFIFGFGQYLVLLYGGHLVLGERMALGELIQFSMYAGMIYGPLAWLTHLPREFARMIAAAARIFEVIDEEPEVSESTEAARHQVVGSIDFKEVTFGYQTHEPVLDDIHLGIRPGEMIGLVGHSGAGKSTLINLILRLYDVDEGAILIDGIDIRNIALQDLRSQIGVVLQETFLFSGSIIDNIRYAKPDATETEVIRAARIAHAHDFIIHFPNGYDTEVGERGQRLSGGEAQRVAIARAIIHDPKILILDEATSSVDTETEQQIQDALGHLVKNRTTIAIAHRLATLRNADRLVVIEKGRVAEVGTHEELMAEKGIYHDLISTQRRMAGAIGTKG
jgi:ATP-binding cassette, subfamily B, bacterial